MREYRLSELYDNVSTNSLSRALLYENGDVLNLHYGDIHLKYSGLLDISNAELPYALKTDYKFKESSRMETGDVIFADAAEDYEGIGKAVEIGQTGAIPSYAGLHTIHLKRKADVLASGYMGYLSQAYAFRRKVWFIAQGAKVLGISSKELLKQSIVIPNITEQNTIVSRLKAVDQKINLLTKKREALETYKKGLMQKIFSQELRFKREDGTDYPEWESIRLGDIVSECKKKSISENEAPVFTSSRRGLLFQTDYFGENRLTERSNVGFNIVPKEYITYRSRSDNRIFTFNQNTLGAEGIISPYYPVFTTTSECNSYFLMIALNYYSNYIGSLSVGTSQTVLSISILKKSNLFLPDKEEQLAITSLLKSADKSIATTENLLTKSLELKKGLLQQMFV